MESAPAYFRSETHTGARSAHRAAAGVLAVLWPLVLAALRTA